jgi:signal transduction histidine kinase
MTAPLALEQQIEALSARLRETEAECAAKDRFIAAISRELNNPLAPVLLAVEHLRSVLPNGDMARLTAAMQLLERATDGFAKRTRALLDMADLSAAAPPLPTVVLDMSALVIQAGSDAAEIARLAGCELELAVAPGLSAVANAEALEHVLGHILANAFRFGAGRPVRLSARLWRNRWQACSHCSAKAARRSNPGLGSACGSRHGSPVPWAAGSASTASRAMARTYM